MKLKIRKVNTLVNLISYLLKSTELTYEDRKNLRKAKDALGDVNLGSSTKINNAIEIYTEMSKHKTYTENETKARELLEKKQADIDEALNAEVDFEFKPFDFATKFKGENANEFYSLAVELEDIILKLVDKK